MLHDDKETFERDLGYFSFCKTQTKCFKPNGDFFQSRARAQKRNTSASQLVHYSQVSTEENVYSKKEMYENYIIIALKR